MVNIVVLGEKKKSYFQYLFSKFSHFPQQTYVSLMEEIEAADSVDAIYAFVVSLSVCEGTPPGSLGLAVVFL